MKLHAIFTSQSNRRINRTNGDEYVEIELSAFGRHIGRVVLETTDDATGTPVQYLLKFAAHRNSLDWVILTEGHKTEGVIQTIQA